MNHLENSIFATENTLRLRAQIRHHTGGGPEEVWESLCALRFFLDAAISEGGDESRYASLVEERVSRSLARDADTASTWHLAWYF